MFQHLRSSRENEFSPFLPFSSIQSLSGLGVTTHIGKTNLVSSDSMLLPRNTLADKFRNNVPPKTSEYPVAPSGYHIKLIVTTVICNEQLKLSGGGQRGEWGTPIVVSTTTKESSVYLLKYVMIEEIKYIWKQKNEQRDLSSPKRIFK